MEIIEAVKGAFKLAQSLDNIELQKKLLDIQEQALELQQKNIELQNRINVLEKEKDIEEKIQRHPDPYITLRDDPDHIPYCATCWSTKHRLVQMFNNDENEILFCPSCNYGCSADYNEWIRKLNTGY